jgi:hypothetical protein
MLLEPWELRIEEIRQFDDVNADIVCLRVYTALYSFCVGEIK